MDSVVPFQTLLGSGVIAVPQAPRPGGYRPTSDNMATVPEGGTQGIPFFPQQFVSSPAPGGGGDNEVTFDDIFGSLPMPLKTPNTPVTTEQLQNLLAMTIEENRARAADSQQQQQEATTPPSRKHKLSRSRDEPAPTRSNKYARQVPDVTDSSSDTGDNDDDSSVTIPPYTGPLPKSYWDLTEIQIASISFKDFSKLMAKSRLTDKEIAEAKRVRRRVKNRHSARLCSSRKREKCLTTETENERLQRRVKELQADNESLLNQHMMLQERTIELQKMDADHVREKLMLQSELQKMKDLLKLVNNSEQGTTVNFDLASLGNSTSGPDASMTYAACA